MRGRVRLARAGNHTLRRLRGDATRDSETDWIPPPFRPARHDPTHAQNSDDALLQYVKKKKTELRIKSAIISFDDDEEEEKIAPAGVPDSLKK